MSMPPSPPAKRHARLLFATAVLLLAGVAPPPATAADSDLAPLPADRRWVLRLDMNLARDLLRDIGVWERLETTAETRDDVTYLLMLLRDMERVTISGANAPGLDGVIAIRMAADTPPWTRYVEGQPDYASAEVAGHTLHSWRSAEGGHLQAGKIGDHLYLSDQRDLVLACLRVAADATQPRLDPGTTFADWPPSLAHTLLLLQAVDLSAYRTKPGQKAPPAGIASLSLQVDRVQTGIDLRAVLTLKDAETAQRFLYVVQGAVSVPILNEQTPEPIRRALAAMRISLEDRQVRVAASYDHDQLRAIADLQLQRLVAPPPTEADGNAVSDTPPLVTPTD